MRTKIVYISIFAFIFSINTFGQFSKFGLQTSNILELNKGKKHKAIFAGEIISVSENYRTTKDTLFFRDLTGTFILFWHDSIKSSDTLIMMPHHIRNYYVLTKYYDKKDGSIKNLDSKIIPSLKDNDHKVGFYDNYKFIKDIAPVKIFYYSIAQILQGRKTYKMRATKTKENVWQ
jgi:hypothetical protein